MARGTEIRQRKIVLTARFNDTEAAAIREKADKRGQSVGGLIRNALLDAPATPIVRRPPANAKAIALVLGQLGKIGSNINQIAHHLNAGRPGDRSEGMIEEALRDVMEIRLACMQALGFERNRKVRGALKDD
jgi:Bacterial mobilisation protein (MobC)